MILGEGLTVFPKVFIKDTMSKTLGYILYTLIIVIGVIAFYTLLNAGNPESLLRNFFPNPGTDIYIAAGSSFVVFVLGFIVFYSRDRQGFRYLVEQNGKKIRTMRKQGKDDMIIAESILAAMGSRSGYRHNLAKKKLLIALSEFV
jgi:hypothetical protein